jgi:hypothetical protein
MPEGRASSALVRVLLGGLLAAFLMDNGTDVAVWLHCGWQGQAGNPCDKDADLRDVRLAGLAVGGFLSIAATAVVVHRRRAAAAEAMTVILGVLAAALVKILDINVGPSMFPETGRAAVALYIWTVVFSGFVLVALAPGPAGAPFLPFGELCVAVLLALLGVAVVFLLPAEAGWTRDDWGTGGYLHAYALAAAPAGWARLMCAATAPGGIAAGVTGRALLVLLTAALCFGYGAGVDGDADYARGTVQPPFTAGLGSLLLLGGGVAVATAVSLWGMGRRSPGGWLMAGCGVAAAAAGLAGAVLGLAGPGFAPARDGAAALRFVAETVAALCLSAAGAAMAPRVAGAISGRGAGQGGRPGRG